MLQIFIDYGEEWENAWEKHVEEWEAPESTDDYVPVRTMIDSGDFRSLEEQETNPYPSNVQLVCYFDECPAEGDEWEGDEEETMDGRYFESIYGVDDGEDYLYPCDIVEKSSDSDDVFDAVRVHCTGKSSVMLTSYPKESVTFRMKRYMSDQHLPGAFRHHIGIDDEIFPPQWKKTKNEDISTPVTAVY